MAYVPIPKDLKKVRRKVAFNLTRRQLIGFTLAKLVGIPVYLFMRKFVANDIAILFLIVSTLVAGGALDARVGRMGCAAHAGTACGPSPGSGSEGAR